MTPFLSSPPVKPLNLLRNLLCSTEHFPFDTNTPGTPSVCMPKYEDNYFPLYSEPQEMVILGSVTSGFNGFLDIFGHFWPKLGGSWICSKAVMLPFTLAELSKNYTLFILADQSGGWDYAGERAQPGVHDSCSLLCSKAKCILLQQMFEFLDIFVLKFEINSLDREITEWIFVGALNVAVQTENRIGLLAPSSLQWLHDRVPITTVCIMRDLCSEPTYGIIIFLTGNHRHPV